MTVSNTTVPVDGYWPCPVNAPSTAQPAVIHRPMTFSNGPGLQHSLTPERSICVNPAALQLTNTAPHEDLHVKPDTLQWVMEGQTEHAQTRQQPRQLMPAPIPSSVVVPRPQPASTGSDQHWPQHRLERSAPLGQNGQGPRQRKGHRRRLRKTPSEQQLGMMSSLRFPNNQQNRSWGGLMGYPSKPSVGNTTIQHRGVPQIDAKAHTKHSVARHGPLSSLEPSGRMSTAPRITIPSIREKLPDMFPEVEQRSTDVAVVQDKE